MKTTGYWDSEKAQTLTGALVLLIVAGLAIYQVGRDGGSDVLAAVLMLSAAQILVFLIFASGWAEQSRQRLVILLWVEAVIITALYFLVDVSFIAIMGIVWIVQATEIFNIRTATWLLIASVSVFALSQFYHWYDRDPVLMMISSVTLGMFHLFAVIATHRANREQELREHTAALNRELIATRELLSQSSRQSERLRIARDLHDLLGHHITALILNLEVATHGAEGKTLQHVEQSLALGKLLLSDLRTAVNELREDDAINLEQSVEKLIAGIPSLKFSVDFSAAPAIREVEVAETLLRCIQEGVTNVLRHSKATRCRIALSEFYNDFFLTIKDNGTTGDPVVPGNGLKGMSERAEAAGGEISWRQEEDGFLLQLRLPAGATMDLGAIT